MASADRAALVTLFHATEGSRWRNKKNWDTDAELAIWHGVEVNDQGRVVKLDLSVNSLRGICHIHEVNGCFRVAELQQVPEAIFFDVKVAVQQQIDGCERRPKRVDWD